MLVWLSIGPIGDNRVFWMDSGSSDSRPSTGGGEIVPQAPKGGDALMSNPHTSG